MKNSHTIAHYAIAILLVSFLLCTLSCKDKKKKSKKRKSAQTEKLSEAELNRLASKDYQFQPRDKYPKPANLRYFNNANEDRSKVIYHEIYPIGWSAEGKFAYIEIPPDEAAGCQTSYFYIKDLITDNIVYTTQSKEYCEDDLYDVFNRSWKSLEPKITAKLNEYHIEPTAGVELLQLPYLYNGNKYDFHLYSRMGRNEMFGIDIAEASVISLKINNQIDKKIYGQTYGKDGPFYNEVIGYFKSPFENRLGVFYVTKRNGWEGIPYVVSFEVIGCQIK